MAACPTCNAPVPLKLAVKSTDFLLFPEAGAEQCPSCHASLIPKKSGIVGSVLLFIAVLAGFLVSMHYRIGGFNPGFGGGFLAGLSISLGGAFVAAKSIRFRSR